MPAPSGFFNRLKKLIEINYGTHRGLVRLLLADLEYFLGRWSPDTIDPPRVKRLVFVCLGNINRSAFAEAVAAQQGARTASLGLSTSTGSPAFHKAIETAAKFGCDLAAHRTTNISDFQPEEGDLFVTMEIRHAKQLLALGYPPEFVTLLGFWAAPQRVHIHDPYTLADEYFPTCFSVIHTGVLNLVEQLRSASSPALEKAASPVPRPIAAAGTR